MNEQILIIALERNPFNELQFNTLARFGLDVTVIYTVEQVDVLNNTEWQEFDAPEYNCIYISGKAHGPLLWQIIRWRRALVVFTGYSSPILMMSMILCYVLGVRYMVFTDTPDIKRCVNLFKTPIRRAARWLAYRASLGVLTTGSPGKEALIELGCAATKIISFPYVAGFEDFFEYAKMPLADEDLLLIRIDARPVIFYSGQLIYRKGLDNLLYALGILKERGCRFYLLIEGEGPIKEFCQELVLKLGIAEDVEFLGFNDSRIHARYLAISDIVVSPSRWDPWGNIVPEGMQLGKLVVAADGVASARDRIVDGYNGVIYEADNVGVLCVKLEELLRDSRLRKRLSDNAKITAEVWRPVFNAVTLSTFLAEHSR